MTTYYFGDMEIGDFADCLGGDYYQVVLIDNVRDVRDFETDEEADAYMMENKYSGYVDANLKNVEIYFRKKP